jgi:hypothetical protein
MIIADLNEQETYQNLSLIINEFEKAALKSSKRESLLAVMNAPLDGMDQVLLGSKKTLTKVQEVRGGAKRQRKASAPAESYGTTSGSPSKSKNMRGVDVSTEPFEATVTEQNQDGLIPLPPTLKLSGGVQLDADLAEIFGENGQDADAIRAYMKDCLGCDSRISFDWQVPAYDLLGPISDMISEINLAMDKIESLTDPTKLLEGFCKAMNDFQIICIPDWTMILMSLKMLLNKYLQFGLSVTLDWTIVLGPLLNIIVDGVAALIQQIAGVLFSPLDCAISVLESLEKLEDAARGAVSTAEALSNGAADYAQAAAAGQFLPNAEAESLTRDFTAKYAKDKNTGKDSSVVTSVGSTVRNSDDPQNKNAWASVWAGLEASTQSKTLVESDNDSLTGVLVAAVKEAKEWIELQVSKILATIKSVKGLVGGGLTLQLQGLGIMTLIIQLIRVVMMIINLLRSGVQPANWCTYLEEHPEMLEDALKKAVDPNASVRRKIITVNGRSTTLESCVSQRTDVDKTVLTQWINDLQKGR